MLLGNIWEKFIALNAYVRKQEMSQSTGLSFYHRNLNKKNNQNPKFAEDNKQ